MNKKYLKPDEGFDNIFIQRETWLNIKNEPEHSWHLKFEDGETEDQQLVCLRVSDLIKMRDLINFTLEEIENEDA